MASGTITGSVYEDDPISPQSRRGFDLYVPVRFEVLLVPGEDRVLARDHLDRPPFNTVNWDTQGSGSEIAAHVVPRLDKLWLRHLRQIKHPMFARRASYTNAVGANVGSRDADEDDDELP